MFYFFRRNGRSVRCEVRADSAGEGYELIVETVAKVEDDATQAEIQQQMTEGFTKADRASSNAFGAWAQETCPPEPPAGAPSEDESPTAP